MSFSTRLLSTLITGAALLGAMPSGAENTAAREQAARAAAGQFLHKLGGALKREIKKGGPDHAIGVCRDLAPQIAGELSRANGWRVTRVGTRVRDPLLGMPDRWERKVLSAFKARAAKGESYRDMTFGAVVDYGGKPHYRFMKAIAVRKVCLKCHGSPQQIPTNVQAKLARTYPHDRATGYKVGELRGAVSINQPLDIPLSAAGAGR